MLLDFKPHFLVCRIRLLSNYMRVRFQQAQYSVETYKLSVNVSYCYYSPTHTPEMDPVVPSYELPEPFACASIVPLTVY